MWVAKTGKNQRLALVCLGITGAVRTTSTSILEVLLAAIYVILLVTHKKSRDEAKIYICSKWH